MSPSKRRASGRSENAIFSTKRWKSSCVKSPSDFVARATVNAEQEYEHWNEMARRLHELAEDGRLADCDADAVRDMVEPTPVEPAETVAGPVGS